ncbi:NAD(P)-binding domain containing protein [Parasponia andersonii]|uniref:NAD(P)-binding domain containing protein n=1 Tax=Parasponia andersonii TaxID=3476 RepID=A0A2P5DLX6_PARAD|nr:NAD(P)-binding domain containing protein [Parasponia andersonii]
MCSCNGTGDPKKTEHLLSLDGAKERLHLFEANLLEEGSFDVVVDGCDGVFHTASPVTFTANDPQEELIEPAVKGTLNVLGSCVKVPSLKRVVLTSSIASVLFNGSPLTPDVVVDETWFSDPVFCEKSELWYMLSKTLAEEAAWKFAKEKGIDLVALNPVYVIGPLLQPTLNFTVEMILNHINEARFPNTVYRYVDVRDVALAHIQAFEVSSASGRYCVVGHMVHLSEALNILRQLYPTLSIPEECEDDKPLVQAYQISNEKVKSLGINFTPLEVTLRDTVESLKEKELLSCESKKMSGEGKVVCVTGASGYIASWLVKLLLQRGYTVKASVRDLSDHKKTDHLLSLDGAKERLHLFEANLLEEGSFDLVVDGCDGVFHTASPVTFTANDPQEELIEPAVKGTLNVLGSCVKVPSLKRVVLTSSIASVLFNGSPLTPDVVVDETWFSDPVFCEKSELWYMLSKTLAEEAAWKFAKEKGIDLVALNPVYVIGPLLQPTLNFTVEMILNHINEARFPNTVYRYVDVRDVALAHIQAFEVSSASGRYCVVGHMVHLSEALNILRQLYPTLSIPEECEDDKPLVQAYQISNEKVKSLGINFTPLEVTLRDTVESLKEKGDHKKTDHLLSLDGAKERLHFFKANVLEEGSFDLLVDGCDGVFHTASPVKFIANDPQGTLNVLRSCVKFPSLKRVVLTSSMAAVLFNERPRTPDVVVDETWLSDLVFCEKTKNWYMLSKTLAEEAAWKFAKENGIDLVVVNPGFVIGPLLQPTLNFTVEMILNHINEARFPDIVYRFVDVRDIALAHIQAFEVASASERYCLVGHVVHLYEALNILRRLYPNLSIPEECEDDKPLQQGYQISKEKAKSLGVNFTPL